VVSFPPADAEIASKWVEIIMKDNKERHGLALVTGANGHLGNNLVRLLLNQGIPVRATVRDSRKTEPFQGLKCDIRQADMLDRHSMLRALGGVVVLYAGGAVFNLWAKYPKTEMYEPNIVGIVNVIEAAAETGVRRIVYISSVAALNYSHQPTCERYGYNPDRRDAYYNSKNDGEQLAFSLAKELGVELVSVLPSAMIGAEAFLPLNVSFIILLLILSKKVPIETNIHLNWIDVKDVAMGCYQAAENGRDGERYILANKTSMSIRETTRIAQINFPDLGIRLPLRVQKFMLYAFAIIMQTSSMVTGKAPLIMIKDIAMFSGLRQDFDISKAQSELGFSPKNQHNTLINAMQYLIENKMLSK